MKKYFPLFLVIVCILSLIGCSKYNAPLSGFIYLKDVENGNVHRVEMGIDENSKQIILSVLNHGHWTDGVPNCGHDYEFTAKNAKLQYHSECGTIYDTTNRCSLLLSDTDQAKINQILGAKDFSYTGSFHYKEDYNYYKDDPGLKQSNFVNTERTEVKDAEQAVALAKKECTISYDSIAVAFDADLKIYRISFYKKDWLGGDQNVYINHEGITQLILYGE